MISTVGRLQHLSTNSSISFENIQHVIFDEADKLLAGDMIDDVIKIITHKTMASSSKKKILMFSATEIADLSILPNKLLQECKILTIGKPSGVCPDIVQNFIEVNGCNRREKLEEILIADDMNGIIIFVKDIATANNLGSYLRCRKINATVLHAERSMTQREQSIKEFRNGTRNILVSTAAICRGLGMCCKTFASNIGLRIKTITLSLYFRLEKCSARYQLRVATNYC